MIQQLNSPLGCFYLLKHYENGQMIETNEPCLNCTCTNSTLMCYLQVCPYVYPVSDKCTIERISGNCCPKITCDACESISRCLLWLQINYLHSGGTGIAWRRAKRMFHRRWSLRWGRSNFYWSDQTMWSLLLCSQCSIVYCSKLQTKHPWLHTSVFYQTVLSISF